MKLDGDSLDLAQETGMTVLSKLKDEEEKSCAKKCFEQQECQVALWHSQSNDIDNCFLVKGHMQQGFVVHAMKYHGHAWTTLQPCGEFRLQGPQQHGDLQPESRWSDWRLINNFESIPAGYSRQEYSYSWQAWDKMCADRGSQLCPSVGLVGDSVSESGTLCEPATGCLRLGLGGDGPDGWVPVGDGPERWLFCGGVPEENANKCSLQVWGTPTSTGPRVRDLVQGQQRHGYAKKALCCRRLAGEKTGPGYEDWALSDPQHQCLLEYGTLYFLRSPDFVEEDWGLGRFFSEEWKLLEAPKTPPTTGGAAPAWDELFCMSKCVKPDCKTFVFDKQTKRCYHSSWLRPRHDDDVQSGPDFANFVSGTYCPVAPKGFCHVDWGFAGTRTNTPEQTAPPELEKKTANDLNRPCRAGREGDTE